jgi:predicted nucleic acid-binding protein
VLLADTSVWISHLHRRDERLAAALEAGHVMMHPFVIGELACGSLRHREAMLADLDRLPAAVLASHAEALHLVTRYRLSGKGIGWIDVHLLASALLSGADLYTHDAALRTAWAQI